jgi:hypothetical protein
MADRDRDDVRAQADNAGPIRRNQPFRWRTNPRKRLRVALLTTIACLLPLLPLSLFAANNFTDLNNGSVHNADIDTVYNLGIANGITDTTYERMA